MTKKDFELIARTIASVPDKVQRILVAHRFAQTLGQTNPRFDAYRFLKACGVAE